MREARLRRLFQRFQCQRDGRALAAIFDATAPELLAVARQVVGTLDEAEDVVQTTYLRLIERPERYDADRPLRAWMYGILVREAARVRRRGARRVDPERLSPRATATPDEEASSRELFGALGGAIARVPPPYREVLEPVLFEQRTPGEVAAALARAPGTVRVQLQRGLERLRALLARERAEARPGRAHTLAALLAPERFDALRARLLESTGAAPLAAPAALGTVALPVGLAAGAAALVVVLVPWRPTHDGPPPGGERSAAGLDGGGATSLSAAAEPVPAMRRPVTSATGGALATPLHRDENGVLVIRREPDPSFDRPITAFVNRVPDGGRDPVSRQAIVEAGLDARVEDLPPGDYVVSTLNAAGPNYVALRLRLAAGCTEEVVLRAGPSRLEGTVTSGGEPAPDVRVTLRSIGLEPQQRATGRVAADGAYELEGLVPGSHSVLVGASGMLTSEHAVDVLPGANRLDLVLPAGRIEGRLEDVELDRRRRGPGPIHLFPYGWYPEAGDRGAYAHPETDGGFRFDRVPPGRYVVSLRAPAYVPARVVELDADGDVATVVLSPARETGSLAGRVEPAPERDASVALFLHEPHGLRRVGYAEIGRDGTFREPALEPGRYALLVSDFGARTPFTWYPDVEVSKDVEATVTISLAPGVRVTVELDARGASVPHAIWKLRLPGGEALSYLFFVGSDAEGRWPGPRPFRLPYGSYEIVADFGDPEPVIRDLEVRPGTELLELVVERP